MKRNTAFVVLFYLLLIAALIFAAAHQALRDAVSSTPAPWLPPLLTPEVSQLTLTPGWWGNIPTAIPLPTLTPTSG